MPPRSICVSRSFPGRRSARPKRRSSCTRSWICGGNIPSFIFISDGKLHDVNILDQLVPEPGAIYVMDRGYIDFDRLGRFHETGSFFVIRAKTYLKAERRYSHAVEPGPSE